MTWSAARDAVKFQQENLNRVEKSVRKLIRHGRQIGPNDPRRCVPRERLARRVRMDLRKQKDGTLGPEVINRNIDDLIGDESDFPFNTLMTPDGALVVIEKPRRKGKSRGR